MLFWFFEVQNFLLVGGSEMVPNQLCSSFLVAVKVVRDFCSAHVDDHIDDFVLLDREGRFGGNGCCQCHQDECLSK